MIGYTVRRCEQLETFPETIEQELRPAVCEHRLTDRLKENYSIDIEKAAVPAKCLLPTIYVTLKVVCENILMISLYGLTAAIMS